MSTILLLSSSKFLLNDINPYLDRPLKDLRIAHIITASKGQGVSHFDYLDRTRSLLQEKTAYSEDLDISGKNELELRGILKNFDGVFVNGGNTFYLLKAIRESAFDKIITELIPQGFIYIGASAGSYVACPTIEVASWPGQEKYHHYDISDYQAMNLVPYLLRVHYEPEDRDIIKNNISKSSYPLRILSDEQAILIKDNKTSFLGGEEIKL